MRIAGAFFSAVIALIPLGCTPEARVDPGAERASLTEAVEAYHAAMSALNPQAAASLYADNVIVIPKGKALFEKKKSAEEYLVAAVGNPGFQASFETLVVEVSSAGATGFSVALVTVKIDGPDSPDGPNGPDGDPVFDLTRDVHFWEKDASGAWRIVLDVWNAAPSEAD